MIGLNVATLWMAVATLMIFFMLAGFLLLEAGSIRAKNSMNVAQRHVSSVIICLVCYSLIDFSFMFGVSSGGFIGTGNVEHVLREDGEWPIRLIFNLALCSVVAAVVSGSLTERMRVGAYFVSTAAIAMFVYPVFGHWAWGNEIIPSNAAVLADLGFLCVVWAFATGFVVIGLLKKAGVLRVSHAQEHLGLNVSEHLPGVDGDELVATISTFETALESMSDGVLIFDRNGEVVQVNAAFKTAMDGLGIRSDVGMTRQEFAESVYQSEAFDTGDQTEQGWVENSLSPDRTMANHEENIATKTGQHFIQRMTPTADGGQVISLTDATEIQNALIQVESAEKAKAEFLANLSREIRTPMNGIIGVTELLGQSKLESRQRHYVDTIQTCGHALMKVIDDALEYPKIEAEQATIDTAPFILRESIEDVTTLLSNSAAEKGIDLLVRYRPDLPSTFIGDIGRVRQVMTNLVSNAIKFTHEGHVLIDVDGEIENDSARLVIRVEDTGIGIPEDQVGDFFENFRRVDGSASREDEDAGAGLSISANLIEMMGGDITVESVMNEGSVFTITLELPVAEDTASPKTPPVEIIGSMILVIDDNAVSRDILTEQILHWKCQSAAVDSAEKGLSVLRKAQTKNVGVDLVIVDFQMPDMNGEDFIDALMAHDDLSSIPTLMLTSVNDGDLEKRLKEKGLSAILTKPAPSSLLLDTIATCLHESQLASVDLEIDELAMDDAFDAVETVADDDDAEVAPWQAPSASKLALAKVEETSAEADDEDDADAPDTSDLPALEILAAEDNETNQNYLEYILDDVDATFEIVSDGALAVKAWRARKPRVILMDVSMPEMTGIEATLKIRELEQELDLPRTPIIGLTAHTLKGDEERCIEAGMDDHMSKPVSVQKVKDMLVKWNVADEVSATG